MKRLSGGPLVEAIANFVYGRRGDQKTDPSADPNTKKKGAPARPLIAASQGLTCIRETIRSVLVFLVEGLANIVDAIVHLILNRRPQLGVRQQETSSHSESRPILGALSSQHI